MVKPFPKLFWIVLFGSLFALQLAWNAYLYILGRHDLAANYWFNVIYGLTPFITGGLMLTYALRNSRGGAVTSAIGYLGLGIFCFGLGLFSWAYYNVIARVPIPHPSAAEVFFLVHPFLLVIGTLRLLVFYVQGIKWRILVEAIFVFFAAALPLYYYFILPGLQPQTLPVTKFIIDGVLIGNSLVLAIVYLILRIGGGRLRGFLLLYGIAFLILVAGDFLFQYRTQLNVYWNGDWPDTLFVIHNYIFAIAAVLTLDAIFGQSGIISNSSQVSSTAAVQAVNPIDVL